MREIGTIISKQDATLFGDYLYAQGIDNAVRQAENGNWSIWIYSEKDVSAANEKLAQFINNPESPEYADISREAEHKRRQKQKEETLIQKKIIKQSDIFKKSLGKPVEPLTMGLIAASCIATLLCMFGENETITSLLKISNYVSATGKFWDGLVEVGRGEVWRLVTPIFIHFSLMHIIFNMLWLNSLGRILENKLGWRFLAALVIVIALCSNIAEYAISGPNFGGMSGVVYGLFGYIWMQWRFKPASGFYMDRITVMTMIGWYFICWTGLVGPIANIAHTAGLIVGVIWGYLSGKFSKK